ncbi:nitrilase [Conidiobolus coronatus NRRL 28638]|uniref:Nitrilase n=1 Tax=Conidiobolus coronatus (strain ATCC 28846 / CBS 209.66 / NRRL 28638) TaxID=796925 RepID=A0A137NWJ1_CONC2|nr:nitrilase [Conidiobolus coronatus NRRL 28638]|eukprot:KXN67142.1 nitrilase [Conidiobolus coronatus NRRL 28638]
MSNLSNTNHLQSTKLKAAVIQAGSINFDLEATLRKLKKMATEASQNGAKIAVFPEAFLGGYPKGSTFGCSIGIREEEGRHWFEKYYRSAIDVPGPIVDELADLSKALDLYLVVGCVERGGNTLYCTIIFFSPTQGYLGKHRKLMPTAAERLIWGFGDGSTLPVFDTEIGNLGGAICWENYMPLLRTRMYEQNIQLYCAPTVDDRASWAPAMQYIAKEGRCYVLSSVQFSKRKDYPIDYPTNLPSDPESVYIRGGSVIVNPMGEIIAGPCYDSETILYADVDLSSIIRARFDFDPVGHYSRPDVFKLTTDTTPRANDNNGEFNQFKFSKDGKLGKL